MRRAPVRSTRSSNRPVALLTAAVSQHGLFGLKLAAGALAAATATLAILNNQDGNQAANLAFEPARNETVIYRQASVPHVHRHDHADEADAIDEHEDQPAAAPSYYTRVVQTIRFLNPNARLAAAREAVPQGLIKVGGFIAFPAKNATDTDDAVKPRKRAASIMNEVDDYLWEVYQRVPVKKDGAGDFTWKDPAAAKRVGMSLQDYVIGGMDPEFREQLYHAGKAMDAAGIQWSLLSAFRDDYRQGIATGFKARGGNSLHGGSRRTGGYGHGRAVDVTGAEGQMSEVWSWLDAHGAKYGLYRPMPGNDPAHVQQRGDWHKIALALREARTRVADAAAGRGKEAGKHKVANASK
jgi:hypothetical protein